MAKTKLKIRKDGSYKAWQPASGTLDGVPVSVYRGEKVRGSDPRAALFADVALVPAEMPESEWPSPYDESVALLQEHESARRAEAEQRAKAHPAMDPQTPLGELVRCTETIVQSRWGPCGKGEIRLRTDPLVVAEPQYFRPLLDETKAR